MNQVNRDTRISRIANLFLNLAGILVLGLALASGAVNVEAVLGLFVTFIVVMIVYLIIQYGQSRRRRVRD